MKQLIAIVFFGMLTMSANAQDSTAMQHRFMIGVHGGVGPASMVGKNNGPKSLTPDLGARLGFMSGMVFQYQIIPRMALCFEMHLPQEDNTLFAFL